MKRKNLNFEEIGISEGSNIEWSKTSETAKIVENNKLYFREQELSLTKASENNNPNPDYCFAFWTFNGKSIMDCYNETHPKT